MTSDRISQWAFIGVSALLFTASAAATVVASLGMSSMGGMPMPPQGWPEAATAFVGMWTVMMVAMMLPSLMPMLTRYRLALGRVGEPRLTLLTLLAASAYFLVWAGVGAIAFALGRTLAVVEMRLPGLAEAAPAATGLAVLVAGALQFTAWKTRHLACCRQMPRAGTRTTGSTAAALRQGLQFGLHCSICCLGLTAILLVLGVMDLRWMVLVTALITAERIFPAGERIARASGAAIIAFGLVLLAQAIPLG